MVWRYLYFGLSVVLLQSARAENAATAPEISPELFKLIDTSNKLRMECETIDRRLLFPTAPANYFKNPQEPAFLQAQVDFDKALHEQHDEVQRAVDSRPMSEVEGVIDSWHSLVACGLELKLNNSSEDAFTQIYQDLSLNWSWERLSTSSLVLMDTALKTNGKPFVRLHKDKDHYVTQLSPSYIQRFIAAKMGHGSNKLIDVSRYLIALQLLENLNDLQNYRLHSSLEIPAALPYNVINRMAFEEHRRADLTMTKLSFVTEEVGRMIVNGDQDPFIPKFLEDLLTQNKLDPKAFESSYLKFRGAHLANKFDIILESKSYVLSTLEKSERKDITAYHVRRIQINEIIGLLRAQTKDQTILKAALEILNTKLPLTVYQKMMERAFSKADISAAAAKDQGRDELLKNLFSVARPTNSYGEAYTTPIKPAVMALAAQALLQGRSSTVDNWIKEVSSQATYEAARAAYQARVSQEISSTCFDSVLDSACAEKAIAFEIAKMPLDQTNVVKTRLSEEKKKLVESDLKALVQLGQLCGFDKKHLSYDMIVPSQVLGANMRALYQNFLDQGTKEGMPLLEAKVGDKTLFELFTEAKDQKNFAYQSFFSSMDQAVEALDTHIREEIGIALKATKLSELDLILKGSFGSDIILKTSPQFQKEYADYLEASSKPSLDEIAMNGFARPYLNRIGLIGAVEIGVEAVSWLGGARVKALRPVVLGMRYAMMEYGATFATLFLLDQSYQYYELRSYNAVRDRARNIYASRAHERGLLSYQEYDAVDSEYKSKLNNFYFSLGLDSVMVGWGIKGIFDSKAQKQIINEFLQDLADFDMNAVRRGEFQSIPGRMAKERVFVSSDYSVETMQFQGPHYGNPAWDKESLAAWERLSARIKNGSTWSWENILNEKPTNEREKQLISALKEFSMQYYLNGMEGL